jgi:hypothetical protein
MRWRAGESQNGTADINVPAKQKLQNFKYQKIPVVCVKTWQKRTRKNLLHCKAAF